MKGLVGLKTVLFITLSTAIAAFVLSLYAVQSVQAPTTVVIPLTPEPTEEATTSATATPTVKIVKPTEKVYPTATEPSPNP